MRVNRHGYVVDTLTDQPLADSPSVGSQVASPSGVLLPHRQILQLISLVAAQARTRALRTRRDRLHRRSRLVTRLALDRLLQVASHLEEHKEATRATPRAARLAVHLEGAFRSGTMHRLAPFRLENQLTSRRAVAFRLVSPPTSRLPVAVFRSASLRTNPHLEVSLLASLPTSLQRVDSHSVSLRKLHLPEVSRLASLLTSRQKVPRRLAAFPSASRRISRRRALPPLASHLASLQTNPQLAASRLVSPRTSQLRVHHRLVAFRSANLPTSQPRMLHRLADSRSVSQPTSQQQVLPPVVSHSESPQISPQTSPRKAHRPVAFPSESLPTSRPITLLRAASLSVSLQTSLRPVALRLASRQTSLMTNLLTSRRAGFRLESQQSRTSLRTSLQQELLPVAFRLASLRKKHQISRQSRRVVFRWVNLRKTSRAPAPQLRRRHFSAARMYRRSCLCGRKSSMLV